ncbi:hypothetical protein EP18_13875 [Lysinibacillus sphaericus]|nr:hypothetical protein [Lysinibacillus sphaericus]KEK11059.1 hypothetical protein EP18_13875 [Lysinibacillus sphaericus]
MSTVTLTAGKDPGNISTKISFINKDGNIDNFEIATVIAEAPATAVNYGGGVDGNTEIPAEDYIHARINSGSLDRSENNLTWFVGELAKNAENKVQPHVEDETADAKFSDDNRALFIIPVLTGMAIAALKNDETIVNVPLSIGVPSENYLKQEQSLKSRFIGQHKIDFIDGPYANKSVEINIEEDTAQIHAESVTTALALQYDIEENVLVENKFFEPIKGQTYTVADLGAGTNDYAVFNQSGLDKVLTRQFTNNGSAGTNVYIDRIINDVYNDEAFSKQREIIEKQNNIKLKPAELTSRETFMKKIVKPVIKKVVNFETGEINNEEVKFTFSWANQKNVDITKHVKKHMTDYANTQIEALQGAWLNANTDHMIAVGGGVLFGYLGGLNKLKDEGIKVPDLKTSQYFTSKSYTIAAYLMNLSKQQDAVKQ